MKLFLNYFLISLFLTPLYLLADEGMWIPSNIPDSIFKQMQLSGFKLLKSDIYNPDSTSFIDAVPMFGKGCSSGVISPDGLIITNYHCARYFIQTHSSVTNNLFQKGFVANDFKEELTNPNLTIEFNHQIIDITNNVLNGTTPNSTIRERDSITSKNISIIEKKFSDSLKLNAIIEPLFFGNKYYLYIREEFKDIRLVYCPPENIAVFGGDKDDWKWPRHSADFAIFRIYSDTLNKPSNISVNNIPYKSKKYFRISTKEKKENDFTMILGYPGITEEYLPTSAIESYRDSILPIKIFARKKRLDIMKHYMDSSIQIHLNYNSKYASSSSYFLKWMSDYNQLSLSNKSIESKNSNFIDSSLLLHLQKAYSILNNSQKKTSFYLEGLLSMDIIRFANKLKTYFQKNESFSKNIYLQIIRNFYKTYTPEIDCDFFLQIVNDVNSISQDKKISEIIDERKNNTKLSQFEKAELKLYKKSILLDSTKLIKTLMNQPENWVNKIKNDHLYLISDKIYSNYFDSDLEIKNQKKIIDSIQRINILKLTNSNKILYSDANSTFRISFGKIKSYESSDAIKMDFKTSMIGLEEKFNTGDTNYTIDKKFLTYITQNTPMCYISTCHTTGGNSGSPILNDIGEFIGLNFDRNIEGTINDYIYRGESARNIWVNSEYIISILKNYSNATHILKSLTISN